jgi:uncharacterized protein
MMELVLIGLVSLGAAILTFFSGFGLGTILLPVFLVFFPIEMAVALTGTVHLLNNLFKLFLTYTHIHYRTAFIFGIASIPAALFGAYILDNLPESTVFKTWSVNDHTFSITLPNMIIGGLLVIFAFLEKLKLSFKNPSSAVVLSGGGILSGFFGGLSGHQGALRTAFLVNALKSKEALIATGVLIACMVDVTRLPVYYKNGFDGDFKTALPYLSAAVFPAFLGAWLGSKFLKKSTYGFVQLIVTIALVLFGLALMLGLL